MISNFSYSPETLNSGQDRWFFLALWPRNFTVDPPKQLGTSSMLLQALCIISYPLMNSNWSYSPETPNLDQIWRFLDPCDLEIWRMTLENNRAPLLCYFTLCASLHTHWWFQSPVTVRNDQFGSKSTIFYAVWPWNLTDDPSKAIGHLFYATSSLCNMS